MRSVVLSGWQRWGWMPIVLGLGACSTATVFETSYESPDSHNVPFHKLAVIGIMRNQSESQAFELGVVQRLEKGHVDAVPGFTVLGSDAKLPEPEMEKRVESTGADGVLIFRVIALDRKRSYVPPTTYTAPDSPYAYWWRDPYWGYYHPYPYHYWGYWYPSMQVVATPGYWTTSNAYRIETALYRTSDNRLTWTATSSTYDPEGEYDLAESVGHVVVNKLNQIGLLQSGGEPERTIAAAHPESRSVPRTAEVPHPINRDPQG
jgi:hypothetical protein